MHRFHIPTMTCGGCANAVTRAIHKIDPGAEVEASPAQRQVAVRSSAKEDTLLGALAQAGYSAEPVAQTGTLG